MPHIEPEQHELQDFEAHSAMDPEEEERGDEAGPATHMINEEDGGTENTVHEARLNRRTIRKLDCILLPFLSLLFLLNSLDKSNIGNAETAHFTHDTGLSPGDLNTSLAFFFAFFVALQPVGAALGRRYGMARWVPACMALWGMSTALHIWVRRRWQLITLRVIIATLEAGFYPTTVSYLSLFYTRYEFAVRLGFFYGQTAVAGALGGILSWAVFKHFPEAPTGPELPPGEISAAAQNEWRSWEVLFLIEGFTTIFVALTGFVWLPHSAESAWFFSPEERQWAEERIRRDRDNSSPTTVRRRSSRKLSRSSLDDTDRPSTSHADDDSDAHHHLLSAYSHDDAPITRKMSTMSAVSVTQDSGLSRHDVLSAILNVKIWQLLVCNILSALPATAFSVFLPLVIKQLSPSLHLSPAESNLLSAPPFAFGAVVLFIFTWWSDRRKERLVPILVGLGILLIGLTLTVMSPMSNYVLRYIALCILLSGSFIASPLTVAWLTNNTPEPGKRAILLGINGWGNLAGVFSALLFTPDDEKSGYIKPFIITLLCVLASFCGFVAFRTLLVRENWWREHVMSAWTEQEREREDVVGDMDLPLTRYERVKRVLGWARAKEKLGIGEHRNGDEKITFRYGL